MFNDEQNAAHQSRVADAQFVSLRSSMICVPCRDVTDTRQQR